MKLSKRKRRSLKCWGEQSNLKKKTGKLTLGDAGTFPDEYILRL